jgi:hypothetical protein
VRVGGHHYAVNVELKELLLAGADSCGKGSRSNRRSQIICRLSGFCLAPNKELDVNVWRAEGVESEPRIAPKIGAFGRMAQDKGPESALRNGRAKRMNPRAAIWSYRCEIAQRWSVLVEQRPSLGRQPRSGTLELSPRRHTEVPSITESCG